jgi:tetratricopeptide (TPR) repeat protein
MRAEISLTPQSTYPVELLQRIRANLGSDYVVTGSYFERQQRVHLDVMLFDLRSGQQVAAIGDESPEDTLPALAGRCAGRVRAQLGVRLPASGLPSLQAGAMEQYARGMERLRQGDALSARPYLEKAVAADPSHPLFHSGLAAVLSALGLDAQAGQEARRALDSSADLGRVEQLEVEGRYRTIAHEWPRAIQVYQALFTLLPDDLEYGLQLGSVEARGSQAQEALRTVKTLRSLPAPLGDDPRIDLTEAQAAGALSDFAHTERAARSAAEKAGARGARLLYARARLLESGAMQNMNMVGFQDVRAEARRICAELGDRLCVAASYRIEANQMTAKGELALAQRLYQEALEIANQTGNSIEKLNALNGLANAAKLEGDLPAAGGYYRSALAVAADLGPQKSFEVYLGLADVLTDSGRLADAHALIQAIAILREINDPYYLGETLLDLGNTQLNQADLAGARKSFEEAGTLGRGFGGGISMPETNLAFARLSLVEGHSVDAVTSARTALSGFTSSGREGGRYQAAALLASALLSGGGTAEASALLAQFPPPDAAKLPARSVVEFEVARCSLLSRTGRGAEAMRAIDVVIATAARRGIPRLEQDAVKAKKVIGQRIRRT